MWPGTAVYGTCELALPTIPSRSDEKKEKCMTTTKDSCLLLSPLYSLLISVTQATTTCTPESLSSSRGMCPVPMCPNTIEQLFKADVPIGHAVICC